MKRTVCTLIVISLFLCGVIAGALDVKIYWDGSIPNAHAYAWDGIPNQGTYFDLGEIGIGSHTYTITNEPTYGGEFLVTTPEVFALIGSLENGWSVGLLQVWCWEDLAGINWYPDAGQYDSWKPEPFMVDYVNGVIPDGIGSWKDGDPYVYAQSLAPAQRTKRGKGHNK